MPDCARRGGSRGASRGVCAAPHHRGRDTLPGTRRPRRPARWGARHGGWIPRRLAIGGLELAALVGTTALLLACRGPGHALVRRLGSRVGLTEARLSRSGEFLERRGVPAIMVGRATPGLRTLTVVATGASGVRLSRALPALFLGSTVFLQAHLVLGMALGPAAAAALDRARLPLLVGVGVLVVAGIVLWVRRRGPRGGELAWSEAGCPVCLVAGGLAPRPGEDGGGR